MNGDTHFTVTHFTGKISYNSKDIVVKNRGFLPPEVIETMRNSKDEIIRLLFSNKVNRAGNLIFPPPESSKTRKIFKFGKLCNDDIKVFLL